MAWQQQITLSEKVLWSSPTEISVSISLIKSASNLLADDEAKRPGDVLWEENGRG